MGIHLLRRYPFLSFVSRLRLSSSSLVFVFLNFLDPFFFNLPIALDRLACSHPNRFSRFYFLRIIFFRACISYIPRFEYFTDLNNPVNDYLCFLLPLLKPAMPHLRLSTAYLLVCNKCYRILRLFILSTQYIMGLRSASSSSDDSNGRPVSLVSDCPKVTKQCPSNVYQSKFLEVSDYTSRGISFKESLRYSKFTGSSVC